MASRRVISVSGFRHVPNVACRHAAFQTLPSKVALENSANSGVSNHPRRLQRGKNPEKASSRFLCRLFERFFARRRRFLGQATRPERGRRRRRRAGKRGCRARAASCRRRVHAFLRRLRACQLASHHASQTRGCSFADLGTGRRCDGSQSRQARLGGCAEAGRSPAHQARTALPAGIVSRCPWVRASLPAVVATWCQTVTSMRHGSFSIAGSLWPIGKVGSPSRPSASEDVGSPHIAGLPGQDAERYVTLSHAHMVQ